MKITKTLLPLALAVMAGLEILTGSLVQAETKPVTTTLEAEIHDPAKQAEYRKQVEKLLLCDELSDPQAKAAAFVKLSMAKWDRKQMGCGVRYGFELAQAQPENIELQLQALGAQVEYFGVLDKNYSRLYSASPVKDVELRLRWTQTRERSQVLLKRLQPLAAQMPEVVALRGLYTLLSLQHEAPEAEKFKAPAIALPDLEAAVKMQSNVLDGGAMLALGSVLTDLPEFLGGDVLRAIELFEQGTQLSPNNLELKTTLINAYLSERENAKAVQVLKQAEKTTAEGRNEQDYADALRLLAGQAVRLEQIELGKGIEARRDAYLAKHPYLDKRKSTATAGHGGVDPITGADQDTIQ